jgi:hypothetical protein
MHPVRKSSVPVGPLISGPAKIEPMRLHVLPRMPASAQPPALAADRAFGPELARRSARDCNILCDWSHRRRPAVESARLRLVLRRADTEKGAGF